MKQSNETPPQPIRVFHGFLFAVFAFAILGLKMALDTLAWPWYWEWTVLLFAILALSYLVSVLTLRPMRKRIRALVNGIDSLKDGDFSLRLSTVKGNEMTEIMGVFNQMAELLQIERREHYQKELLLETVLTHTETAFLITNSMKRILFANRVAKQWVAKRFHWEGLDFNDVLTLFPPSLAEALAEGQTATISLSSPVPGTYQVGHWTFDLNQQSHHLYVIRDITNELTRQEISIWKKVLRLVNHELNNSLTPVSSLFHTARIYLDRDNSKEKLLDLFDIIQKRLENLKSFLSDYAQFARLPQPHKELIQWRDFLEELLPLAPFHFAGDPPENKMAIDPLQMKQVLINLHKNALEAGSDPELIELKIFNLTPTNCMIQVLDRGEGMDEALMQQALLPFFSTRKEGSGLGLALSREIVEAHGGSLNLRNRNPGLEVQIIIPISSSI